MKRSRLYEYINALEHRICFEGCGLTKDDFTLVREARNKIHTTKASNSEMVNRELCESVIGAISSIVEKREDGFNFNFAYPI